jgi:phosphoribosylformylglycinamidine synthase subunit PurS
MKSFKAQIKITLRKGILDVQGKAVEHALHSIEFPMLSGVRIGKYVELDVEAPNAQTAKELVKNASEKLIANPIIEDFDITVTESFVESGIN